MSVPYRYPDRTRANPYPQPRLLSRTRQSSMFETIKSWLRVTDDDSDAEISRLMHAAVDYFESRTGVAMQPSTWRMDLDRFPSGSDGIRLPMAPLHEASINELKYVDAEGVEQLLDPLADPPAVRLWLESTYAGQVLPAEHWPDAIADRRPDAVQLTVAGGFGSAETGQPPADMVHAIELLVQHWFENPSAMGSSSSAPAEFALQSLLGTYSLGTYACGETAI